MSDDDSPCSCIIDTGGLHDIANATGNMKVAALQKLKSGLIIVPSWAFQELAEAYPEEAEELAVQIDTKAIMKKAISVSAARIAERRNSGFSKGPHDNLTVIHTAAVAMMKGYRVITAQSDVVAYDNIGCDACDLDTWMGDQ